MRVLIDHLGNRSTTACSRALHLLQLSDQFLTTRLSPLSRCVPLSPCLLPSKFVTLHAAFRDSFIRLANVSDIGPLQPSFKEQESRFMITSPQHWTRRCDRPPVVCAPSDSRATEPTPRRCLPKDKLNSEQVPQTEATLLEKEKKTNGHCRGAPQQNSKCEKEMVPARIELQENYKKKVTSHLAHWPRLI